tara:strand:+ start:4503 stop:4652 length:150 start_codon:yes stop_codon:yes gene_type:complete
MSFGPEVIQERFSNLIALHQYFQYQLTVEHKWLANQAADYTLSPDFVQD